MLDGGHRAALAPLPPAGVAGKICSCQDATNNTYSCVGTITAKENTLFWLFYVVNTAMTSPYMVEFYDNAKVRILCRLLCLLNPPLPSLSSVSVFSFTV